MRVALRYDVLVVGGGIIGLATARTLQRLRPGLRLAVVEKEPALGRHQTGHNSGVLHSGVYYKPGSLKATLCTRGKQAMEEFATEHEIPFERVGKLIVAVDETELPRLDDLRDRATANGVPGLRELAREEISEIEPAVVGVRGLHVPYTGIIDYSAVTAALAEEVRAAGGEIQVGEEVVRTTPTSRGVTVTTRGQDLETRTVIACAGLQSDRLARRSGLSVPLRIVPFRGDYYTLVGRAAELVRGLVYPVPDPQFPFLGVHFTRKMDGSVVAGPNAVLSLARERYRRTGFDPRDAYSALTFPGIWRFVVRHGRLAASEVWRDAVKRAFVADMARYVPAVTGADARFGPSGIRAQAMRRDGTLVDDFVIEGRDRMMHVLNAPSPGATSSLAIGEEIAGRAISDLLDA
jgi:L-2-hydroxyglutarate oxidase LhgO